jgi:hypothetical protein
MTEFGFSFFSDAGPSPAENPQGWRSVPDPGSVLGSENKAGLRRYPYLPACMVKGTAADLPRQNRKNALRLIPILIPFLRIRRL